MGGGDECSGWLVLRYSSTGAQRGECEDVWAYLSPSSGPRRRYVSGLLCHFQRDYRPWILSSCAKDHWRHMVLCTQSTASETHRNGT